MKAHLSGVWHVVMISLTIAVTPLGGCGTIPDLKGFADATGDIRAGITVVGNEFAESIPADLQKCGPTSCREKFENVWKSRIEAVAAFASYSDSLAQIAAAGNDGAATAEKVLSSANGLLSALSVAPISGAIATALTKGLAELAKFRALKSMGDAIDAAHKPIEGIVELLDKDLAQLESITTSEISIALAGLVEAEDKEQLGASIERARSTVAEYRRLISDEFFGLRSIAVNLADIKAKKPPSNPNACERQDTCIVAPRAVDQRLGKIRQHLAKLAVVAHDVRSNAASWSDRIFYEV
ncbi:MAG: hypothetical protein ACKVQU_00460 [Burkholderiales bacterium]